VLVRSVAGQRNHPHHRLVHPTDELMVLQVRQTRQATMDFAMLLIQWQMTAASIQGASPLHVLSTGEMVSLQVL
jgi:hypothetical protein